MEETINELEDRALEIEEMILESENVQLRTQISKIRRESITLRRYLAPQKEAMYKLYHDKISWLSEYDRIELRR